MVTAMVENDVDEVAVMGVPDLWKILPEDTMHSVAFWYLLEAIKQGARGIIPLGPPHDIEWTFASAPGEIEAIELKHPCNECQDAKEQSARALKDGSQTRIAFVQFRQRYLQDARSLGDPHAMKLQGWDHPGQTIELDPKIADVADMELFAWVGPDEFDASRGIKTGVVPAGDNVPLVAKGEHKDRMLNMRPQMEQLARNYGNTIKLVRFRFAGVVDTVGE